MNIELRRYLEHLTGNRASDAEELFAKLLAPNDDSGRHGVVVPTSTYGFLPELEIPDPSKNETLLIPAFDSTKQRRRSLAYKYYARYPERRLTRLPWALNDRNASWRLLVVARMREGRSEALAYDAITSNEQRFEGILKLLFPAGAAIATGAYVSLPVSAPSFTADANLQDLLDEFDEVKSRGFVPSMRTGTTGVGYTFETLLGIKENNDQTADYKGIEIKTGILNGRGGASSGLTNLFQLGPQWATPGTGIDRLRLLGTTNEDGRLSCHSRVTTSPNSRDLVLSTAERQLQLSILKSQTPIGSWSTERIAQRLAEKHSRAVFVKAARRRGAAGDLFHYRELVYCERPNIERFIDMVESRRIVFEFMMHQSENGSVRNHGYPWRLVDQRELDQLFALQVTLRQ